MVVRQFSVQKVLIVLGHMMRYDSLKRDLIEGKGGRASFQLRKCPSLQETKSDNIEEFVYRFCELIASHLQIVNAIYERCQNRTLLSKCSGHICQYLYNGMDRPPNRHFVWINHQHFALGGNAGKYGKFLVLLKGVQTYSRHLVKYMSYSIDPFS